MEGVGSISAALAMEYQCLHGDTGDASDAGDATIDYLRGQRSITPPANLTDFRKLVDTIYIFFRAYEFTDKLSSPVSGVIGDTLDNATEIKKSMDTGTI
jgi:hypothetical protein